MGATSSKLDDDKALQVCRERKKYVRQALDGRCALASAHITYIHSLKLTGTSLRKFLQPDVPLESSLYTSTSATPEPFALTDRSVSQFSFLSPSVSQNAAETNDHLSPSHSSPISSQYQVYHMKFRGSFTKKVEEKPPVAVTGTVTSMSTPQNNTTRSYERAEPSPCETPTHQPETSPWDYFGLFHPIDNHFPSDDQREAAPNDDIRHFKEDEDMPDTENEEEKISCYDHESQRSESEDEFDDPSSDTLVRTFKNLSREESDVTADASLKLDKVGGSGVSVNDLSNEERVRSPKLSPLMTKPSEATITTEAVVEPLEEERNVHKSGQEKGTPVKGERNEHKVIRKDLFSSMKDVEYLFVKASDSGKEVPRMLEANKLHFRPLEPRQELGASVTPTFLKACFSCGKDPGQVQEEPAQASVKYLTWHRTASSRSSSSRNFLDPTTRDDVEDYNSGLFENVYMISGGHASTLDRLFAWEKKLYDEVKASQVIRRHYDMKCKLLREQESRCESQHKIDKTRALVKDLHSRIRVAIQRIDSISRRIEEMRDKELQPQLEELIQGLRRMWEVMYECHKSQVNIISNADSNFSARFFLVSDARHHVATQLKDDLNNLASSFPKWINALKTYIKAINDWLLRCVSLQEKSSKKRRYGPSPQQMLRMKGPPIYTTCGVWHDLLEKLPMNETVDPIKGLASEVSRFLPRQEKKRTTTEGGDPELMMPTSRQSYEEGYSQFQSSFVIFLRQMSGFAEQSVKMYEELQTNVEDAKRNYEHKMCQP